MNQMMAWLSSYAIFYFPLGVVGIWRWAVWGIKKFVAAFYRDETGTYHATVSVVTPVYNEHPGLFLDALKSWQRNGVDEIIAVIDSTDQPCIETFKQFAASDKRYRLVVTTVPGKRPALAEGIRAAASDIIALVDSDTIWSSNVKTASLLPFRDPQIGGVGTRQEVLAAHTVAQRVFNAQLGLRYFEELPFLLALGGKIVMCLSGRTAFYRRAALLPVVDAMLRETFWGKPVVSGEDKRLTYLVESTGWNVAFQQSAVVYTPGTPTLRTFLKQRLRWTRNSWRADLRTLTQAWVYQHPRFVWYLLDRIAQPFALLLSPIFFVISLFLGWWEIAVAQLVWWHAGRVIRLYPHLKRHPGDSALIPLFVVLNFCLGVLKIYALVTLNRQGWITRWDASRLPASPRWLAAGASYMVTIGIVLGLVGGVVAYNHPRGVNATGATELTAWPPLPTVTPPLFDATLQHYQIQPGDTITTITNRFDITEPQLLAANRPWLPSREFITAGMTVTIPARPLVATETDYTSDHDRLGRLFITYDAPTNTIEVTGRGRQVTLSDIRRSVPPDKLQEVAKGEWYLTANLHLRTGVTLHLRSPEVRWLKLASSPDRFVWLRATNGQIAIQGSAVTSWDSSRGTVDEDIADGRSYIIASHISRLDIRDAELAYLGYAGSENGPAATFGVAWKSPDTSGDRYLLTGVVQRSRFHHNYHGAYVSGALGMIWRDNEFFNNHEYGLDFFGQSTDSLIERNRSHDNGLHGIILAARSNRNLVQHNESYQNGAHGIMVHGDSGQVVIRNNTVHHQRDGIVIYDSSDAVIADNTITTTDRGIRLAAHASRTVIYRNTISDSSRYGIYIADEATTTWILHNLIQKSITAFYIKTADNIVGLNTIETADTAMYVLAAANNTFVQNKIVGVRYGLRIKAIPRGQNNFLGGNTFETTRYPVSSSS